MRRVTILDRISEDADARLFRVAFWLSTPAGRQAYYANPAATSVLAGDPDPDVAPTAAEAAALVDGSVVERLEVVALPKRNAAGALYPEAQFRTQSATRLKAAYDALAAEVAQFNPKILYGSRYTDEAGWIVKAIP